MELTESGDIYFDYVEEQVKSFQQYMELYDTEKQEISPYVLQKSLAEYTQILVALTAEYERIDRDARRMKREFGMWWDEKYCEMRRILNPPTNPGNKWLSKGEIESETRAANKAEYLEKIEPLEEIEAKLGFINRLIKAWTKHADVLANLSYNSRVEQKTIDRENYVVKKVSNERKARRRE